MTNWESARKALGIKEEQCTVYKVDGRRRTLTKSAAIRASLKKLASELDGPCECARGDSVTPGYSCGCVERRDKMIARMTPVAKALPASREEWERRIRAYQEAGFLDDSIWEEKPQK